MGVKGLSGQKFLERGIKTFYYDKGGGREGEGERIKSCLHSLEISWPSGSHKNKLSPDVSPSTILVDPVLLFIFCFTTFPGEPVL